MTRTDGERNLIGLSGVYRVGRVMEIVVANDLEVRAVVLTLRAKGSALEFRLFPMLHLGTRSYYDTVRARAEECDLVVAEGVGEARKASLLTMTYRMAARNPRLGLIVQDLGKDSFTVPTLCPDLRGADFDGGWRGVPLRDRAMLWCMAPIVALLLRGFASRRFLARRLTIDDEPAGHPGMDEIMPELDHLVTGRRDALLVDALTDLHERRGQERITVGVVYGAEHMRAVVRTLRARHGYVVRGGEYVTVFPL